VKLAEPTTSTARAPAPVVASPPECYDVLLLAGTPRRLTCTLAGDIAAGALIDAEGAQWTVADVRRSDTDPTRLICIYAD
jgi:hypothetical protein